MKIKRIKLSILCCIVSTGMLAQTNGYQYTAHINAVDSSGFYNILLSPAINAHLKTDYSDLRVVNDSGRWLPHVTWAPGEHYTLELPPAILKIIKQDGTDVIVAVKDSGTNELILEIKNSLAERSCSISGSDDLENWFTITDSVRIIPENKPGTDNSEFILKFPTVSYRYFKIHIFNNGKQPFNIIHVKTTSPLLFFSSYKRSYFDDIENPVCNIVQQESGSNSIIRVTQSAAFHFNNIVLKISGAKYFNRHAEIYFPYSANHSFSNPGQLQQSIVLSNNSTLTFPLAVSNPDTFYIVIHNEDNPPLKLTAVTTQMSYTVATAWLEKGLHYKLLLGNSLATAPVYDLQLKDIAVQQELPNAVTGAVTKIAQVTVVEKSATKNTELVWLAIAAAVAVLGFFTYKLITDINKSKS